MKTLTITMNSGTETSRALNIDGVTSLRKTVLSKTVMEVTAVTLLAAITRLAWVFTTPMPEAPDEHCHAWVARYLLEHNCLPSAQDTLQAGVIAVYGSLPQLGYIPHVVAAHLFPQFSQLLDFRIGSAFMGIAAVVVAYFIGAELFPKERLRKLALPLLMVFHPQLTFVNGYTNNDSTACFLGTCAIYICARIINRGLTRTWSILLGFVLGWIALTKYSSYSLFAGSAFAFIAAAILHRTSLAKVAQCLNDALLSCITVCGWWFFRQMHEYPDDLLGTKTMYHTWAVRFHKPLNFQCSLWQIITLPAYWQLKFQSFWGLLGPLNKPLWQPFYAAYAFFMLAACAGGTIAIFKHKVFTTFMRFAQAKFEDINLESRELKSAALIFTFLIAVLVNLASMIWAASVNLGLAQGRYLFGLEAPILLLLIYAFGMFGRKVEMALINAILLVNMVAYGSAFMHLLPTYGWHIPG